MCYSSQPTVCTVLVTGVASGCRNTINKALFLIGLISFDPLMHSVYGVCVDRLAFKKTKRYKKNSELQQQMQQWIIRPPDSTEIRINELPVVALTRAFAPGLSLPRLNRRLIDKLIPLTAALWSYLCNDSRLSRRFYQPGGQRRPRSHFGESLTRDAVWKIQMKAVGGCRCDWHGCVCVGGVGWGGGVVWFLTDA